MKQYSVIYYYSGLLILCLYIKVRSLENKSEIPLVYAVAGEIATIPCYVSTPLEDDEATMILWYRLDMPNPIYTLDIRNVPFKSARHFPASEMEGRLKFNVNIHPPVLYITPVRTDDEAEYKCRVDLRRSRTLILQSRLIIIVPPSDPLIMDEHGQRVNGIVGPYDEGSRVTIFCDVDGGNPTPSLTWWHGSNLLDEKYVVLKRRFVRNKLVLPRIQRSDLMMELSCKASNTNLTNPKEATVRLDINLYILSVTIMEPKYPLLSGEKSEIACETIGSRPRPITTWWLDDEMFGPGTPARSREQSNTSISLFQFIPKPDDNGRRLVCKSVNPAFPNITVESEMNLRVHFIPILNISSGEHYNQTEVLEGTDIYLSCTVWANPKMSEVSWMFNEKEVAVQKTERTITSNFTLTLKKVTREQGGKYRCLAANTVGQGSSSNFYLLVKYIPVCKHPNPKIYGVAETETVSVTCDIDAEPQDAVFRWSFVNDFQTLILQNWTSNETNNAITYSPKAENGYGMLSCWGRNSVGLQLDPCLIKIVPAGAPETPNACSVINQTIANLTVQCEAGYNGSLLQTFHMEVYDSVIEHLEQNITTVDKPTFLIKGLAPGTSYLLVIYASNSKGRSKSVVFMASTLLPAEKRTATEESSLMLTSTIIIVITAIASVFFSVVIGVTLAAFILRFRRRPRGKRSDPSNQEFTANSENIKKEEEDSQDTSEKGPDIIPFTIEPEAVKMGQQIFTLQESSPERPVRQKYTHTVL